ncbi:hypothetical protein B0H13DRAFT_2291507 [Mycena leptocephala]|nr:hypothetical protein B0H13DRAFT_2291507 [Mycena leptocephala]
MARLRPLLTFLALPLARAAIAVYQAPGQAAFATGSAAAAASAYMGAAAYNPTTLVAPPVPTPAVPSSFQIQLNNGGTPGVPFLNLMANIQQRAGSVRVRVGGNSQESATPVPAASIPDGKILQKNLTGVTGTTQTPPLEYSDELFYMVWRMARSTCGDDEMSNLLFGVVRKARVVDALTPIPRWGWGGGWRCARLRDVERVESTRVHEEASRIAHVLPVDESVRSRMGCRDELDEPRATTLSLDSRASTTLVSRFSNAPVLWVSRAGHVRASGVRRRRWRDGDEYASVAKMCTTEWAAREFARRRMRLEARYGSAAARVSMRLRDETVTSAQAQGVHCNMTIRSRCVVEALVRMPSTSNTALAGVLAHAYVRYETSTGVEALTSGEAGPSNT